RRPIPSTRSAGRRGRCSEAFRSHALVCRHTPRSRETSMRYAVSPLPDETDGRADVGDDSGTTSVRFGDVLFHMTEKSRWGGRAKTAVAAGARLERLPHATPRERLHLVVQKGRLFQQEHPKVPVLLD